MSAVRARLGLTSQVALLSLIPILVLGFVLARVIQGQVVDSALSDAAESAQLIARLGIQPRLTPQELRHGMSVNGVRALDMQLQARSSRRDLARIKIWNTSDRVIYSDDHRLINRTLQPSDDLRDALQGKPKGAEVIAPSLHSETASEVGLGKLVEVYVPLRFGSSPHPAGAFEIYLVYAPIGATIAREERVIGMVLFAGLALLWAVLYRIVARASRTLRRQSRENDHLARYDQLTGLPNRTLFIERVEQALAQDEISRLAIMLVDIDGFKEINDTLGHQTGDTLLREIATRISSASGQDGIAARMGGDEYGLVLRDAPSSDRALAVASTVQTHLLEPITLDGVALNIETSIGIAHGSSEVSDPVELLRRADVALDQAKSLRTGIEVYAPEMNNFSARRLALLGRVRPALTDGEFVLHYQPQADLQSARITGVEALLRWEHPEHGMLGPMEFIPLIERTALVGPIARMVIDQALAQALHWRKTNLELGISVNLSARNLADVELAPDVQALLAKHSVAADQLTLEVTESAALTDPERAVRVLGSLRELGVRISIDDFGTGHASIAYLTRLPLDEIKIDRSLVAAMEGGGRGEAIVRSTLDLAESLGLQVVAEGIETYDVWERLAELGCRIGQGYFIARPLCATDLQRWINSLSADRRVPAHALS
ncbi:MAG TPA: bifunctional diguanylate cyclase/phosphodiesterase [Solirubrobacteraceae bacterium]|jgi:diguanylate cyclase (GGDEF)-like protein